MSKNKENNTAKPITVIGKQSPNVYRLEQIYDPDKHKYKEDYIVPGIGSLVVEKIEDSNIRYLYAVKYVDPKTFKSTLVPISLKDNKHDIKVITYGNDLLFLLYDDRVHRTRLVIDEAIIIYGASAKEYKLVKITKDGTRVPISLYVDSHGNIISDRVPIIDTPIEGIKKCLNCRTEYPMTRGENIVLELYNTQGVMCAEINLISRHALVLNDFEKETNPIIDFDAIVNQKDGSKWVLFVGQSVNELTIYPEIIFLDGTRRIVPIDNKDCFIYGLEDIKTKAPNVEYKVMVKYFLNDSIPSSIAIGKARRFVVIDAIVVIKPNTDRAFSKISVLPKWVNGKWVLHFFGYYHNYRTYKVIPIDDIAYPDNKFDPKRYGEQQKIKIQLPYVQASGKTTIYEQEFVITVNLNTATEPFLLQENEKSIHIYGRNDAPYHKPEIKYDGEKEQYFIPTSSFMTVQKFLINFYENIDPPYDKQEYEQPPVPTHFTIRDIMNGRVLLTAPIQIDPSYSAPMNFVTEGPADRYNNTTVVVEFLIHREGQSYQIVYGVPVMVSSGQLLNQVTD